ncbi:hypothetical protein LOC51_08630 [Rubrivivax sp. JA1024]|nr:hypothetical protein [Rubrivivax sp. JA1024]
MSDDNLRMRAVVEDGYSAPLADLRKKLRGVNGDSTARSMQRDWKAVGKEVDNVGKGLSVGIGALRGIGVASLAAGLGLTGLMRAASAVSSKVFKFSDNARGLRMFSQEVGLSVQQLRVMRLHTEHLGMSWDSAQGNLKSFSTNMFWMRKRWGEAYNELRGMNLGSLAEEMIGAKDNKEALDIAMEGIKNIKDPTLQRRVAETLLGSDMWAVVAREGYAQVQREVAAKLKQLSAGAISDADKLARSKLGLDIEKENLENNLLSPLQTPVERGTSLYGWGLGKFNKGLGSVEQRSTFMDLQVSARLEQEKKALESIRQLIEDTRKRGETVAPALLQRQAELIKSVEGLTKALEKAQGGFQNQSFNGVGPGLRGGGIIPASLGLPRGVGLPQMPPLPRFGNGDYPLIDLERPGSGGGSRRPGRDRGGAGSAAPRRPGYADDQAGAGLSGSEFLKARRERFAKELEEKPWLKKKLAAVLDLENPGAGPAVVESLMNRMDYTGGTIEKGLGVKNRRNSFYGPVRRGEDLARERALEKDPKKMAYLMRQIDKALAGSNVVKGHTDQGSAGDPNYHSGGTGVNINGERFNHWRGGPDGIRGAKRYQEWVMRNVEAERARKSAAKGKIAPAENTVDLLAAARRADGATMRHQVEGSASLRIDLNGLPTGAKVKSSFDGMFREVRLSRSRPMQSADDVGP